METKQYIETLKKKTKEPVPVAMRQALCYYLRKNQIPSCIIARVFGMTRMNVHNCIKKADELLSVSDRMMCEAYAEIGRHDIIINPYTINLNVLTKFGGYRMIIDNIIY